jgi:hypothetical protein
MDIQHVRVGELPDFVESDKFKKSQAIPVSHLRAVSQFHNPSADSSDIALLLSYDEKGELIGYIGILPCSMYYGKEKRKIYSNTGWWVHPRQGRKVAMHLFYSMLEYYGKTMFFSDLTPHTSQILKATHLFNLTEPVIGNKWFLRFSFADFLPRKYPVFGNGKVLLKWIDSALNAVLLIIYRRVKKNETQGIHFHRVEAPDDETAHFIENVTQGEICFRKKEELQWILEFPWLRVSGGQDQEAAKYHFSTVCKEFSTHCYKIFRKETMIGFVFLTSRDGHFKMPYYFCNPRDNDDVFWVLVMLLVKLKALSFTTWQAAVIQYVGRMGYSFLYAKRLIKQEAYSNELSDLFADKLRMQDGDGDMSFT